ncbi:MAG: rhodanese-like domain-containing protein [Bryobacteraceae bacterium]
MVRHILNLSLIAVLLIGAAFAQQGIKQLTTEELSALLEKEENIFYLDVREPSEIEQHGSVKGYVNIPVSQVEKRLSEIPKDKVIVTL